MLHDEFPRLYLPPLQSREVLRMLRYRQKLIKMRTIGKNSLQALALQSGLAKGPHWFTKAGLQELDSAPMSPAMEWQRKQWLQLLEPLNERLLETMLWLKQQSVADQRIDRLRTHPGVGLLTALCLVHSLEPVSRFANSRKVTAYAGLDPLERSSAERQRFLGSAKAARACFVFYWWKQPTRPFARMLS